MHWSSSYFIRSFIWFECSLRFSNLYLILLIKNMFVLLSEIKIINSLKLLLLLYQLDLVLHVFSLLLLLFFNKFVNKLFGLDLLWEKSWVINLRSLGFLAILFHCFSNQSLIFKSFLILFILYQFLFLLLR